MRISVAIISALMALSPCAFAQGNAAPDKPAKPPASAPAVPASAPQAPAAEKAADDEKAAEEQEKKAREDASRAAAQQKALDYQRYKDDLMKQCIIKPVMTDDEINLCKKAYKA
jgi:pyruvate/2-oxoglutarate dehydrogenase complex dihydrolipoamide acyltransferase (E2) component